MSASLNQLVRDAGPASRPNAVPIVLSLALLLFVGGYFFSCLVRKPYALILSRLMADFEFGSRELGLLTAVIRCVMTLQALGFFWLVRPEAVARAPFVLSLAEIVK